MTMPEPAKQGPYEAVPLSDSMKRWRVLGPFTAPHHETGEYEAKAAARMLNTGYIAACERYRPLVEASRELLAAVLHGSGPYMTERAIENVSAALAALEQPQ